MVCSFVHRIMVAAGLWDFGGAGGVGNGEWLLHNSLNYFCSISGRKINTTGNWTVYCNELEVIVNKFTPENDCVDQLY